MKILLLVLFLFTTLFMSAQGVLKGQLSTPNDEVIGYATISLYGKSDSLILGTISDDLGKFELKDIPYKECQLKINFLGFVEKTETILLDENTKVYNLGKIVLQYDDKVLDEVLIRAEKSKYVVKMDKKIFNVGKDMLTTGGSALDVLTQVPQVTVQPNGSVELRGRSDVQILINGRRSALGAGDALEQLDVNDIQKVEVITNPSASFDASGAAGIINIILKRPRGEGLKGQISTTVGAPANHMVRPGLSYKGADFNIFGSARLRYSDYNGIYTSKQNNTNPSDIFVLSHNEKEKRHDDGLSFYGGADYYISDQSSLTLAYYRRKTKDTDETNLNYNYESESTSEGFVRSGASLENRSYNQIETNYTHKFNEKGREIKIDFQYEFWNSEKKWSLDTEDKILPKDIPEALRTTNNAGSNDLMIASDYSLPLKQGKIELGVKWEKRKINNDFNAEELHLEEWKLFNGINNSVNYGETIAAAYTKYSGEISKVAYQIGFRVENSDISIEDEEGIYADKKNYLDVFPSAHLSYPISENTSLQGGYSRRIQRPSLWNLYPFDELTDVNIVRTGNPDLNPSYVDNYELTLNTSLGGVLIYPGVYYRNTNQPFENYITQNSLGFFNLTTVNIDDFNELGLELYMQYTPIAPIRLSGEINFNQFDQSGNHEGRDMSAEGTVWWYRLTSSIRLGKTRARISYQYRGPRKNAQVDYLSSSDLSISIGKSMMNDKLDIGIRASNILDTRTRKSIATDLHYIIEQSARRYGPRASLNITYKFNYADRDRERSAQRGNR